MRGGYIEANSMGGRAIPKHTGVPVGVLPRTGERFYFHRKDKYWPADYVYEDGISLSVMDYTDALRVAGVYPTEYEEKA